jgi:hypothetical protein
MNCTICKSKIQETFLKKIIGTYIKDKKGKKKPVCSECQSKLSEEEIKEKIN